MQLFDGTLNEHSVSVTTKYNRKAHKKEYYCKDILTLDIEVTSAWIENGKVVPYRTGESAEHWNNLTPLALPYIWQFSWNDKVFYGREFSQLNSVFEKLGTKVKYIIWVHNLSYEWHFLNNILTWKSVFARSPHKPIKATPNEYPNIEFRCSYMLTRLSLESWGKQLGVYKLVGDLDYEVLRTPLTALTERELAYCERDCLVVYAGIKDYLKRYNDQWDIPLTQTGTVRREVKERLLKNKDYAKFIKKLVPENAERYKILQTVFSGGYTHANRMYAGVVIDESDGIIQHYDFASSYPTVMIAEKYPMTPWAYTGKHELPSEDTFDEYAYIFLLKFSQLNCMSYNTYIQSSKGNGTNIRYDNGRVIHADEWTMYLTEQDYLTVKETYSWEDVQVLKVYRSRKEYLPIEFTNYILELYKNKTELKGVPEKEDLYMQSKQYINSLFGMTVTAIMQADVTYSDGVWETQILTADMVNEYLNKLRDFHSREKRYFLSYSWGCWVTAYARRNLWRCIESVDEYMLYCDTDSIFCLGNHDFSWYNEEITSKLKKACDIMGLDFNMTHPKTINGKTKPLGIFEREDDCTEFITLGAKRYVERRVSDGKLHLTVSGINKGAVELLNDHIENFVENFDFDKDAPCVKKRLATYCDNMPEVTFPDGYHSTYKYGINMRRTGYKLTMTDEYKELIDYMTLLEDVPEQYYISRRGRFTI